MDYGGPVDPKRRRKHFGDSASARTLHAQSEVNEGISYRHAPDRHGPSNLQSLRPLNPATGTSSGSSLRGVATADADVNGQVSTSLRVHAHARGTLAALPDSTVNVGPATASSSVVAHSYEFNKSPPSLTNDKCLECQVSAHSPLMKGLSSGMSPARSGGDMNVLGSGMSDCDHESGGDSMSDHDHESGGGGISDFDHERGGWHECSRLRVECWHE